MAEKHGSGPTTKNQPQTREDRLKAALKANLARRKAQGRLRAQAAETDVTASVGPGQEKDA